MANHSPGLDQVFGALSNETRRGIIRRLVQGPASVGQLAEPLAMSLPSLMQHLQVLQDSGLVTTRKVGRIRTCALEPDGIRRAQAWLDGQRSEWETRLDRLGDILDETGPDD